MKLIKHFPIAVLPAALAIASLSVYADQSAEQVIVTGTYNPTPVEQISSAVSVLDRADIASLNKTNLADLLQTVPGILVERQGGPGGLAVASIRGGDSNYTVVMIDGVAMNDPGNSRGGAFDLGSINPDSIERIEIVRGPQSAIYGANAVAGVINIISLRPANGHQQMLTASGGADGYQQAGFSALGATDTTDYSFQARTRDSGEPVQGSEAKDSEVNLRLGWKPSDAHRITASLRYFDGKRSSYPEQSGGPEFAQSPLLDHTDFTDKSGALGWQYQIADQWKSNLQATLYRRSEDYTSPGIAPYNAIPPNGANTEFERKQITWVNTLGQEGKLWANVGLEHLNEKGDSKGYLDFGFVMPTDFALERATNSLFVNLNAQVNEKLLLQASTRNDDNDDFGNRTSSKIGLRYELDEAIIFHTNIGNGYKLPSFYALGHPLVGNPNLKPERVKSWDAGITWQASEQLSTSVDYFQNTYRDFIDFDAELFTNVNREQIDTSGVEWQANWHSTNNRFRINANATYTDIDIKNSASVLTGRPKWHAGVAAMWQINDQWRSSLDYQQFADQYATSQHTGDATLETLNGYERIDATIFWALNNSLTLNFTLENVLDKTAHTAVGFPTPGLLWRAGLRWSFGQ
ncbi:MAG: TonB-dependent receptor [Gammaproteobacteria bacterium]|nr:MAG: TonB-dependent receptor [Gammaproteobacteria bacterium]